MTHPRSKTIEQDWTAEQARKIADANERSARESGTRVGQIASSDQSSLSPEGDLEARGAEFPRAKLKEQRLRAEKPRAGGVESKPAASETAEQEADVTSAGEHEEPEKNG